MTKFFSVLLWFCCLFAFFRPATSSADIYKYTDSHVVSMTDRLDAVPARYRSRMTVVKDASATKPKAAPEAAQSQAPVMADSAPDLPKSAQSDFAGGRKFQELSATYPWFRPLSYLAVALAALLILNKISSLLPSRLLARAISFACAVAVIGFLFKSYSERVAETSHKLKEEAVSVVKKSQARQQSLPSEHDFSPRAPEAAAVR